MVANGLEPGDFKYVDQNKDGKIDNKDRVTLGSYIPNFNYGINLGFSYKNFDFSMVMQGVAGNQIVNRKRGVRLLSLLCENYPFYVFGAYLIKIL